MAHEAHHDSHHTTTENKTKTSSGASFWFVIILVGLFIAAVNFVTVMSHDDSEGGHDNGHGTEHVAPAAHGEANMHTDNHEAAGAEHETNEEAHH